MERSDEELSSPVTVNRSLLVQHSQTHPATCSGDDGEVAAGAHVQCVDFATSSQISSCHRQEADNHCGGGATRGTVLHLDKPAFQVDVNPVTLDSDSDSQKPRASTPDPQDVNSDDDSSIVEPPPLGELAVPTATFSKNTFESGRTQSAPGQLVQEDPGPQSELQSRRPHIVEYFSR